MTETRVSNGHFYGDLRDPSDQTRLRHARECHTGFPVGRYLQPPPMLFSRDGHNVFLGDMYRGQSAFLVCSGPSLKSHDLDKLSQRGVLTMAVNNAATVIRPQLWCSVDDPTHFCDAIWNDAGILKFVPLCHMEKHFLVRGKDDELLPSQDRVGDMPSTFGYRRNEDFVADQWLYEDTFNWGNHSDRVDSSGNKGSRSVMYIAIRLLFYLGIRRLFLLGCDFRMKEGKPNYAFEQDRSPASVRGNNCSYDILNDRLRQLLPSFEREGFQINNCTPDSGLTAFPHVPYEEAISLATQHIPRRIITAGMYDRADKGPAGKLVTADDMSALGDTVPEATVVIPVDGNSISYLEHTWSTWMKFRPWISERPVVFLHTHDLDPQRMLPGAVLDHPNLRFVPWEVCPGTNTQAERLANFVRMPAREVTTPWYLLLSPDVVSTSKNARIPVSWFQSDMAGRSLAFVAPQWSYSKPAHVVADLDSWGDKVSGLEGFPSLKLPYRADRDRIHYPTVSSWCYFGNTAWTRKVAEFLKAGVPNADHGTYMSYCAYRLQDVHLRVPLKGFGWDHSFSWDVPQVSQRCRELLAGEAQ